jgi:hypothetical protein
MLFAHDQILLTKYEDDLQYSVHNLNNTVEEFSTEINTGKTKLLFSEERKQSEARYA